MAGRAASKSAKSGGKTSGFTNKHIDGNRQRCITCGHPRQEHRHEGCSVPHCKCVDYGSLAAVVSQAEPASK